MAVPESRQTFEVAAAQTSGLVNLVFFECEDPFMVNNRARCSKRMAIRPGFENIS